MTFLQHINIIDFLSFFDQKSTIIYYFTKTVLISIKNKNMKIKDFLYLLILIVFTTNCSKKEINPITGEEKLPEINPQEKAKQYAQKGGGIFGDFTKNKNTTYNFSTSNVMWRASLKTLNTIPLQTVDYAGGVIVTDWYAPENSDQKTSIKININFLTDKVSANSFEISAFKKLCNDNFTSCKIIKLNNFFNNQIKEKIMQEVVQLNLQESKKEK